jgi:hypothetical protein
LFSAESFTAAQICSSDQHDQTDARRPQQFAEALQKCAVTIDRFRADENLQIADQVPDHEMNIPRPVNAMMYFLPSDDVKNPVTTFIEPPFRQSDPRSLDNQMFPKQSPFIKTI